MNVLNNLPITYAWTTGLNAPKIYSNVPHPRHVKAQSWLKDKVNSYATIQDKTIPASLI